MRLSQAIKGLIVVVAVIFGTAASASAHAGHDHAQLSATYTLESSRLASAASQAGGKYSGVTVRRISTKVNAPAGAGQSVQTVSNRSGGAACAPGACCCQGASSCGMGGHCPSMLPDTSDWINDLSHHKRYHLARMGWVYPDITTGLDRPPKA